MVPASDLTLPSTPQVEAVTPPEMAAPLPWLRPLVAAVVLLLALFTLLDVALAFVTRSMPMLHYVAVPIAVGVMVTAWFAELAECRWPRLLFAAVVTAPNIWLAAIGHNSLNFLFLMLTVAWVTYHGDRVMGLVALAFNLSVIAISTLVYVANGQFYLVNWIPWTLGLVLTWWATRALVSQQRLTIELRGAQHDLMQWAAENQRLRDAAERRLRDVEALYRADEALYSDLRTERVLQALVEVVVEVGAADQSAVLICDGTAERLIVGASHDGGTAWAADVLAQLNRMPMAHVLEQLTSNGHLLTVSDLTSEGEPDAIERSQMPMTMSSTPAMPTLLLVPILVQEQVLGVLVVGYRQPHSFCDDERRLFVALVQRTSLALENARLYEQARLTALLEERQRLARELHDAVTQTLFASSLIADVLPRLWERDPDDGRRRLIELRALTRGALAEMRTLLYELRPSALTEVPLDDLLRQVVDATSGHMGVPVSLMVEGKRSLPPDVQVALYRIAQEALHNIAKHAQASRVEISLSFRAEIVELCVRDDGQGFDQGRIPPGHLGVGIMHERASAIGATLDISSQPGDGTCVMVMWSEDTGSEHDE